MARKTHPISYRLGVTTWWPNRDPINISNPKNNRYSAISSIITGIATKLGIKISQPRIWNTVTSKNQITMLISKIAKNRPAEIETANEVPVIGKVRKSAEISRVTEAKNRIRASKTTTIYWMSYLTALISTYENERYISDIREIQEELTQGTASMMAQSVMKSERGIVPTMTEIQRRIAMNQAKMDQQRNK